MLPFSVSVALLTLACAFCLLAAFAFGRALSARRVRYGAVSWFDARRWAVLVLPGACSVLVAGLLVEAALPAAARAGLAVLVGGGLLMLAAALVLRSRITVGTEGVTTPEQFVRWNAVDDYLEVCTGLVLFHRNAGGRRCRLELRVPARHRARIGQITSACLDARFEYAARIYAGRQAQEG